MGTIIGFNDIYDIVGIGRTYDLLREKSSNLIYKREAGMTVPVYTQKGEHCTYSELKEYLAMLRKPQRGVIAS